MGMLIKIPWFPTLMRVKSHQEEEMFMTKPWFCVKVTLGIEQHLEVQLSLGVKGAIARGKDRFRFF